MQIRKLIGLAVFAAVGLFGLGTIWAATVPVVPGCASNVYTEYSGNFNPEDFELINTGFDQDGYLVLNTGYQAIDPNQIVIPFTQEVSVTFLYERAGYRFSDFGWMLAESGVDGVRHEVYQDVNDNNNNGVLDRGPSDDTNAYGDANGDGSIDARDNRQVLGTFAGGTELVFYLKVDNENQTFHTKEEWNQDTYTSNSGECAEDSAGKKFTKTYWLGRPLANEGVCILESNWMTAEAHERARDLFDLEFADADQATLDIKRDKPFGHVIIGAPGNKPNEWVLGWEDLGGGGDTDHNDMVFQIERETGGLAQLQSTKAIVPPGAEDYFTGVTVQLYDQMPCAGQTAITYYVSIDNGDNWVEITGWDEVYSYTLAADGAKTLGDEVSNWTPGNPEYTYRTRRVDFSGRGLSGNQLTWKAELTSQEAACEPRVTGLALDGSVATHGTFSRSSPVVIANMIYSGSFETPAASWTDKEMRGHLVATQLYDPRNPNDTLTATIWDAGEKLTSPATRNIKFPDISAFAVADEELARGADSQKTFSGKLDSHPVLATSIRITDQTETFYDTHTDVLEGSLGGTGTINRFTGEFTLTFNSAPNPDQPITASYTYYETRQQMLDFTTADNNVTTDMLGLDDTLIIPEGKIYDFDASGEVDADDANYLVNWVRGYKAGTSTPREWLLGPIDHSVPAGATPPGRPSWLFGTDISSAEKASYDEFQALQAERGTVIYVGARDGMLHAFDGGRFRRGDNPQSNTVKELRGYFEWDDRIEDCPDYCSSDCSECPDYGTGEELWAFIPANLIPRLKNNLLKADDQAYVDASPTLADVFIGGQWRTVLLSAEGNGGDTVFCLDITVPTDPKFLWEFADPDLFRSRSSPSVAQIGRIVDNGTAKWVAFFVSGKTYDATLFPSVFMIDIADGSVVRRISLDTDPGGIGGVLSGQPTIVDSDGNGYIDRIYIGSDKGRLYKINIPDNPNRKAYDITHCVINNDFTVDGVEPIDEDQRWHPIYGSPVAIVRNGLTADGNLAYNIRIFFGTGDSPYYDESIDSGNTVYHFFAYSDRNGKGECAQEAVELDWFRELEAGERIFSSAFAAAGNIYFGTSTAETEDPCAGGGPSSSVSGGSVYSFSYEGELVRNIEVGNITTSPLVVDKHLYLKSQTLGLRSFGSGPYNNQTTMGGNPQFTLRNWRELF